MATAVRTSPDWLVEIFSGHGQVISRQNQNDSANSRVILTATESCRLILQKASDLGRHTNLYKTVNGVLRGRAAGI